MLMPRGGGRCHDPAWSPTFPQMSASIAGTRQRILLIDDDELICGSLRQYLLLQGCDVDVALEPATAVELMAAHEYRAVVIDPYLTGGIHPDNTALLDRVCALRRHAAVIVLTAYGSAALELAAARCNVTALLTKPQSVVVLERIIRGAATAAANPTKYEQMEERT
jgi:DNA-binding NtrC family response regulator